MSRFHTWLKVLDPNQARPRSRRQRSADRYEIDILLQTRLQVYVWWDLGFLKFLTHYILAQRRETSLWDWLRQKSKPVNSHARECLA